MPSRMHEVRIEQTRRARHGQDKTVSLDDLMVDAVHIVAVAGISRQVLERIVVVNKRHGIAFETEIPNKAVVLEQAETVPAAVIERLPDLLLQREVKRAALETALVIDAFYPRLDVVGSAPELTHRESGSHLSVVVSEMLGLKATRVVISEPDITQLVLEVVQIGEHLLLRGGIVVVYVTGPRSLASIAATVGVAAAHTALVIPTDVLTLAVLVPFPLDAVSPACRGAYDVDLIDEVGGVVHPAPCAQASFVVGDDILHRPCSCRLVGTDEVDEFGLGAEVAFGRPPCAVDVIAHATAMVEIEDRDKPHAVRVVDQVAVMRAYPGAVVARTPSLSLGSEDGLVGADGGTALREPQQVNVRGDVVLLAQQAIPSRHGDIPLVVLTPSGPVHGRHRLIRLTIGKTEAVPKEALQHDTSIVRGPSLGKQSQRRQQRQDR